MTYRGSIQFQEDQNRFPKAQTDFQSQKIDSQRPKIYLQRPKNDSYRLKINSVGSNGMWKLNFGSIFGLYPSILGLRP